jgi:hypothetical protein
MLYSQRKWDPNGFRSEAMSVGAENETMSNGSSVATGLPKTGVLPTMRDEADSDRAEAEHNTIFDSLVKVEGEVAGLVAYSIYKQNKRAWLQDFIKASGRPPSEAETRAYIIGESTDRRLATYRHLAEATLAGQGPEAPSSAGRAMRKAPARPASFFVVWAIVLVAAIALLAFALHSGLGVGK